MILENLSPDAAEGLAPLVAQDSPLEAGRYVVKHTKEATASAWNEQVQSTVWFRTPPLTEDTIRRIAGVRLFAESHDQGYVSDRSQGNWTWFELAIFEDEEAVEPRSKEDLQLVEFYCENRFGKDDYDWLHGHPFEKRRESLLNLLKEGNTLGVRICARFAGWEIWARTGYLVLEIEKGVVEPKPVPIDKMGRLAQEIKRIDVAIQEVNKYTDAPFKPAVPESVYKVGDIERGSGKPSLRVLCLDGGGVRGLASLYLLRAVMERYDPSGRIRPHEVFDIIGGASTGGLLAIMLGCLKMSVDECIQAYLDVMGKVFNKGFVPDPAKVAIWGSKYSAEILENETKRLIRQYHGSKDENAELFDLDNDCKVFVLSVDGEAPNNREPIFLRSYSNKYAISELPNIKIWQAARATSAAPSFFDPLEINKRKLVDGGLAANNPLGWLWTEIVGVYGPARPTKCFLSIGTGIPSRVPIPSNLFWLPYKGMDALSGIASNTEIVHVLFRTLIDALAPTAGDPKYWRLNISKQITKRSEGFVFIGEKEVEVKLDDSDEAAKKAMLDAAIEFIRDEDKLIRQCAKALEL